MLGDMCGWTRAREKETDRLRDRERERGRRSRYRSTGYRREMAFTRDKDSLMDDSARCFGRSSDTPMIFWWFDRRWHDDEFARGPFATVRTSVIQKRLTTARWTATNRLDGWYRCSPLAAQTLGRRPRFENSSLRNWFCNWVNTDLGWKRIKLWLDLKKELSKEIRAIYLTNGNWKLGNLTESNMMMTMMTIRMMALHFFYVVLFAATWEKLEEAFHQAFKWFFL